MTQSEVDAYQANQRQREIKRGVAPTEFTPPLELKLKDKESALHRLILQYCQTRRWLCLHGSTAHRAMRTLGEPDFVIFGSEKRYWLIECKTKEGKLSPQQQVVKMLAEMNGHEYHVVRSIEEFYKAIGESEIKTPPD